MEYFFVQLKLVAIATGIETTRWWRFRLETKIEPLGIRVRNAIELNAQIVEPGGSVARMQHSEIDVRCIRRYIKLNLVARPGGRTSWPTVLHVVKCHRPGTEFTVDTPPQASPAAAN